MVGGVHPHLDVAFHWLWLLVQVQDGEGHQVGG